jgi:hypothetical protein
VAGAEADGDGRGEAAEVAPVKKGRTRLKMAAAVLLVVIIIPLLYFVIIPRTELTLKVSYNESLLNQINVDPELRNGGTVGISGLVLNITVVNSTDSEMGSREYSVSSISPFSGPARLPVLSFRGDQYDEYTILIELSFSAGGQAYSRHWSHETDEPWMNQDFMETVSGS